MRELINNMNRKEWIDAIYKITVVILLGYISYHITDDNWRSEISVDNFPSSISVDNFPR